MKKIPRFSTDLIEQLVKDEPELDIKPDVKMEVIMFRSGRIKTLLSVSAFGRSVQFLRII